MAFALSYRQDRRASLIQAGPDNQRREAMNIKVHNQGVRFSLACLLLILGVAWGSPAWPAPPSDKPGGGPPDRATTTAGTSTTTAGVTHSGRAFCAFANVHLLGPVVRPQPLSGPAELPPGGGSPPPPLA